jgi:hypothetical protein
MSTRCYNYFAFMILDADIAKQISELMVEIYRQLGESVKTVGRSCSPEEYAAYNKAVGKVVARIVFDVLEPLYEKHSSLRPPGWED